MRKSLTAIFGAALCCMILTPLSSRAQPLVVEKGQKIAFLGDSITAGGAKKNGYITLVMEALNHEGLELTRITAGKSGNKSNDMLARLERDVISKQPDWMTLSCGVNDVWHYQLKLGNRTFEGIPLDQYKKNIRAIIEQAQVAGIQVMVLTSTMIGEDPERELNKNLVPYNAFLREIAKEKNCRLADLSRDMYKTLQAMPDEPGKARMFGEPGYRREIKNKLTSDGCHMNALGNRMMAKGVLRAFGLPEPRILAAEKRWEETP